MVLDAKPSQGALHSLQGLNPAGEGGWAQPPFGSSLPIAFAGAFGPADHPFQLRQLHGTR